MAVSTILHPVFVRFVALPRSLLSRLQNKDGDSNWSNFEDQTESYRTLNVPCPTITNSAESAKVYFVRYCSARALGNFTPI